MRFSRILALTTLAMAALTFAAPVSPARAADAAPAASAAKPMKIATIDDQKLLSDSKAAKSIESQLTAKQASFQKDFTALEKKLREKEKTLLSSKDKMKPEDFAKQSAAFQTEVANAQKLAQTRHIVLQKAAATALSTLRTQITKIVADLADKNGYTLVLTRQNVVLAQDDMDITSQVLGQLDQTMTSVPMTFDEDAAKADAAAAAAPAAGKAK